VVIQSIVVGNYGSFDSDAVQYYRELAELTDGNFFEAADASQVPLVLEQTIQDIPSVDGGSDEDFLAGIGMLAIGLFCLLLLVLLGIGVFILLFLGKKKRRRQPVPSAPYAAQSMPAAAPRHVSQPQPPSTSEPNWRDDTLLRTGVASGTEVVVTSGANVGQRYTLGGSTRLGRAPDNEIVLPDAQASRHHAIINFDGARFEVVDLGSANGTAVNGHRIDGPVPLQSGDVITVGDVMLTFREG
jgi:hypothetical protein